LLISHEIVPGFLYIENHFVYEKRLLVIKLIFLNEETKRNLHLWENSGSKVNKLIAASKMKKITVNLPASGNIYCSFADFSLCLIFNSIKFFLEL